MNEEPKTHTLVRTKQGKLRIQGQRRMIVSGDLLAICVGTYWISGIVSVHKNCYIVAHSTDDTYVLLEGTYVKLL